MFPLHDAGLRDLLGAGAARPVDRRRARHAARDALRRRRASDHGGGARARAIKAQKDFDDTINDPQQMAVALAESIAEGDWRLFFIHRDRWRKLTPADVTRVARRIPEGVEPDARHVPARGEARPRAARRPRSTCRRSCSNYKGEPPVAAGEAFDPTPANLEARTERIAAAERHEGRAAAEEDARRNGADSSCASTSATSRRCATAKPVSSLTAAMLDARHREARPAGVPGCARQAAREARHRRRRRDGDRLGDDRARERARRAAARGRGAARAGVLAVRIRAAEARAADASSSKAAPIRRRSRGARLRARAIRIRPTTFATRRRSTRRSRASRRSTSMP